MNTINWAKTLGMGLLLWLMYFIFYSAIIAWGISAHSFWFEALTITFSIILAYSFAIIMQPRTLGEAASEGLSWVVIFILLDLAIGNRFVPGLFNQWSYWVSLGIIFLLPMLEEKLSEPSLPVI